MYLYAYVTVPWNYYVHAVFQPLNIAQLDRIYTIEVRCCGDSFILSWSKGCVAGVQESKWVSKRALDYTSKKEFHYVNHSWDT